MSEIKTKTFEKLKNYKTNEPLLTKNQSFNLYHLTYKGQKIFNDLFSIYDLETFLNSCDDVESGVNEIIEISKRTKNVFFYTHWFNEAQDEFRKEIDEFNSTVQIANGLVTCPKCKSRNTSYTMVQTRSADEGMTTVCTCFNCGNNWRYN